MKRFKLFSLFFQLILFILITLFAGVSAGEDFSDWMTMETDTSVFFTDICGSSGSELFAVGSGYDYETMQYDGIILKYDGKEWQKTYRTGFRYIKGIWGNSASDMVAVGGLYDDASSEYHALILRYDGANWHQTETGVTAWLSGVWGSSMSDIFAVGDSGTILHYDGTEWHEMNSNTNKNLRSVWGDSGSNVFVVGDDGIILHYDGTEWHEIAGLTEKNLRGVWGSSGSDIFVVGDSGTILHYDGTDWLTMTNNTEADLKGVWGSSGSDIFAVGDVGAILHYDGTDWNLMNSGTTQRIRSIMGYSDRDVFAVGDYSTILRYRPLRLEIPENATEGDGVLSGQGRVSVEHPSDNDLLVSLITLPTLPNDTFGTPDNTLEISVPATITIPAGNTSATFDLTITEDNLIDGSPIVAIIASAAGYTYGKDTIQVIDNETNHLSIQIPENVAEGDETIQGTVSVETAVGKDVAISLTSDDISEISVPESIIIPLNQTSAVFDLIIHDDTEIDGIQTATITASVAGWTSGSNTIQVNDNELRELSISFDAEKISEENGVLSDAGMVSVPGTVVSDLTVHLISDNPLKITVPETLTIPSGKSSASFDLTVIEDSEIDGNQTVTITVSADGWTAGSSAIEVNDNDPGTLKFGSGNYEAVETGGSVTVTVIRELSATGRITADYITRDKTASADKDYTAASGTLVFEEGETSKSFSIPILDDSAAEGDETIQLFLTKSSGGAKLGDPVVLAIIDDEMTCLTAEPSEDEVLLNWCEPFQSEGFVGYNIYREGIKLNTDPVMEMSYTVTESEYGRYCYTVGTLYENEAGKMSNEACALVASDYSLSFDGVKGYAGISEISGLDFSANQSFTIELWVKADEERSDPAIISNKDWRSGYNSGFAIAQRNKAWWANVGDGSTRSDIKDIGDICDGEWHHLTMVIDREKKKMKAFQDGNKKGETDISDIRDMNTDLALNLGQDGRGAYGKWFKGAMDEIRIWRVARTDEEIRSSVFTPLAGDEPGLILYWQMDKATSGVLTDKSGNGNHGTIQKGCEWIAGVPSGDMLLNRSLKVEVEQEGNVSLTWEHLDDLTGYNVYRNGSKINTGILTTPGYTDSDVIKDNSYCYSIAPVYAETGEGNITDEICVEIAAEYALQLDGADDYIELPGADILGLRYGNFTVEAWVNIDDTAHYQPILSASPQLFLGIRDRRPYMSFEFDNSKETNDLEGDVVIHENHWYHIAWRYSRTEGPIGEQAIFVNGIPVGSEDGHYAFHGLGTAEIGRIGTARFNGIIDEIRIWNTARTEAEIASAMYTKLAGNEAGLIAYLPADEWSPILTDLSGNENHGTMMMGAAYSKSASYNYLSRIPRFPNVVGSSDAGVWLSWTYPGLPENLLGYNILRDGVKINTEMLTDTTYTDRAITSGDTYCYTVEAAYTDTDKTSLSNELCMLTAPDYALSFNGIDNYAGIPNLSGFEFSADQSFTVELWVKVDEKRSDPAIISNKDWDLGRNKGFVFAQMTSNWKVNLGDGSNRIDIGMPALPVNEWHHLAMVIDRETQQIKMFQDGNKVKEEDISGIGDMNSGLNLNIAQDGTCKYGHYFKGEFDEVRVWSVARTDEEIRSAMFTHLTGDEPGLAVSWTMDEWNIATMTDSSDNGNHGKIYGAMPVAGTPLEMLGRIPQNLAVIPDPNAGLSRLSWNAPNLNENLSGYHILRNGELLDTGILTETAYIDTDLLSEKSYCYAVQAVYNDTAESSLSVAEGSLSDEACTVITDNYALNFDKNDHVLIPNEAHFDFKNAVTLEAWIQVSQFDKEWQAIVTKGDVSWQLQRYRSTNNIEFIVGDTNIAGNMDVNDGDWHHVAGVYDGNTLSLYIDGELDNSASAEPVDSINTDAPVMIGDNSEAKGRNFDGKICEVRVWSVARTQEEIQSTLYKRLKGNENGLTGYWRMDEPGETLTDYSGNGNHGIISGTEWLQGAPIAE